MEGYETLENEIPIDEPIHRKPTSSHKHLAADDVVQHLYQFNERFTHLPASYLIKTFCRLFRDVMVFVIATVGPFINTTSGYIYLNYMGKVEVLTAYGLYRFIFFAFHMALISTNLENLGIELSASIGMKDYYGCRNLLSKGAVTMFGLICFITIPVSLICGVVLEAMGVSHFDAVTTHNSMVASLPMFILMLVKDLMMTHCMAQGLEWYFGVLCIFSSAFAVAFNYFTMVVWDLEIYGWIISRSTASLLELLFVMYIYFKKTVPESRGLVSFSETTTGFCSFFVESMKFSLSGYSEFFGAEITGVFVLLSNKVYQIGAFYTVMNICNITYCIGYAFAIVARTRMNILIGKGLRETARNFFEFYIICVMGCGVVYGILLIAAKDGLAKIYASSHPELESWFTTLLIILALICHSEIALSCSQVGLKTIGKVGYMLFLSVTLALLGNTIGGIIYMFSGFSVTFIFSYAMCNIVILNATILYKALSSDWKHLREDKV